MTGSQGNALAGTTAVSPEQTENRRRMVPANKDGTRKNCLDACRRVDRICRDEMFYATISAMTSTDPGWLEPVVAAYRRAMEWT